MLTNIFEVDRLPETYLAGYKQSGENFHNAYSYDTDRYEHENRPVNTDQAVRRVILERESQKHQELRLSSRLMPGTAGGSAAADTAFNSGQFCIFSKLEVPFYLQHFIPSLHLKIVVHWFMMS